MKFDRSTLVVGLVVAVLASVVLLFYFAPAGPREAPPPGYTPIRDDALAARYLPSFACPPEFGPILAVYYRAARDEAGIVHLAYHPVWARERNDARGFKPWLSRNLYTGGLSLQRAMFGKGDIEVVGLTVDPAKGEVLSLDYETARDYDPSAFSVTHEAVSEKAPVSQPVALEVMSWNHLFRRVSPAAAIPMAAPPLSYFTSRLWQEYGIWKNPETRVRKDRAHFDWERAVAPGGD